MSSSPITLLGGSLVFERAGQALIAMDPDAISVVELGAGGRTTRIPIRDARAVAAFADQLWVATHDDQLVRMDHAGRPLAPPCALPFSGRAMLQPAPCGPPAAVWSSHPAVALIDDFGQLVATELPAVDLALPLTGRRFVTARGAKLTLPSGLVTALPPNTTVLGGAVMADGKSVALLVGQGGGRQLFVVSLGTGQITQRCAVRSPTLRIATRRSHVIVQLEPRVLWALDLHAGRELGAIAFDHDVADFAIDPGGHRLAVRSDGCAIDLHPLADLLRRSATSAPATSPPAPDATPEVATAGADRAAEVAARPTTEPYLAVAAPDPEPPASAVIAARLITEPYLAVAAPDPELPASAVIAARLITEAAAPDPELPASAVVAARPITEAAKPDPERPASAHRASPTITKPEPAAPECREAPLAASDGADRGPTLTALVPRTRPAAIDRDRGAPAARRASCARVALWTLGAIADGVGQPQARLRQRGQASLRARGRRDPRHEPRLRAPTTSSPRATQLAEHEQAIAADPLAGARSTRRSAR